MKNITITLDEQTARWARIEAAHRGTSVSRLIGEILREQCAREDRYEIARERFFQRQASELKPRGDRYPARETLYDRNVLR